MLMNAPPGHVELRLFMHGVVAEIDGLRRGLGIVRAPRLTPQPLLGQRKYGDGMLRVIREILYSYKAHAFMPVSLDIKLWIISSSKIIPDLDLRVNWDLARGCHTQRGDDHRPQNA
jgi:hypothetical protein